MVWQPVSKQTPEDTADSVDTCGGTWFPTEASPCWRSVWPKHRGHSYGAKALGALSLSTLRPVSAAVPIKTSLMSPFHASVLSFHRPQRAEPPSPLPGRGVSRTARGGLRAQSWRGLIPFTPTPSSILSPAPPPCHTQPLCACFQSWEAHCLSSSDLSM